MTTVKKPVNEAGRSTITLFSAELKDIDVARKVFANEIGVRKLSRSAFLRALACRYMRERGLGDRLSAAG